MPIIPNLTISIVRDQREKAFRAGVRSSDYASHTALKVALDSFILGVFGHETLERIKDPIRNKE